MTPKEYEQSPRGKYNRQRANAHKRGIGWELTFPQWWDMWQKSGKWEQRGREAGQYYMCRFGDTGPYSDDNVRIDTMSSNALESWAVRKAAELVPELDPFRPYPRTTAWDYPVTSDWLRFARRLQQRKRMASTLKESA